jgi:hypothetical protein
MSNKELLQGLKNIIEHFEQQEGGTINLIRLIEDEGEEVTDELILYLWNNVKDSKNIKVNSLINNIPLSIKVYPIY